MRFLTIRLACSGLGKEDLTETGDTVVVLRRIGSICFEKSNSGNGLNIDVRRHKDF